ncbi:MAG: hypothetical protein U1E83_10200 [Methylotetracoccus sp.]
MTTITSLVDRLRHAAVHDTDTMATAVLTGFMALLALIVLI